MIDERDRRDLGEQPPWPYISSAARPRRLSAHLFLYGVVAIGGYLIIRWLTGALAEVIVGVIG